jgi:hypothetical protein
VNGISNDDEVMSYAENKVTTEVIKIIWQDTKNYIHNYLVESFDWTDFNSGMANLNTVLQKRYIAKKQDIPIGQIINILLIESLEIPSRKFMPQLHQQFQPDTDLKLLTNECWQRK